MKNFLFLCFSVLLFLSCDMFNKDIIEYLDYYTNTAGIALVRYDGDYPVSKSMTNLPSTNGDKDVLLVLRNPQEYELEIGVEWDDDFISVLKRTPTLGDDYTINQTEPSIITLTFLESFLQEIDTSTVDGIEEVCLKVLLTESITGREFESFDFDVMINTTPTIPEPAALVVSEDVDAEWVLAFNVLSPSARKGVHNDLVSVNINNTNYDIEINSDGTFDLDGPFTTSAPSVSYADALGQSFAHTSGSTVYFDTNIPRDTPTSYTISFTDKNGVTSSVASVTSEGNKVTDFYVSETAASDGSGSLSNPYNTVQSAVDAIKILNAINPGADTYTIYIKGTITQGSSTNAMVDIIETKALNIVLQSWDNNTATINASGKGKRVLYITGPETNVTLNKIILTGGRVVGGSGNPGSTGDEGSTIFGKELPESGGAGGAGGAAYGGGVYISQSTLTMDNNSKITNCNVIGGSGGVGGTGGDAYHSGTYSYANGAGGGSGGTGGVAYGGGVYLLNEAELQLLFGAEISSNTAQGGTGGRGGTGGKSATVAGSGGSGGSGGAGGAASGGGIYVSTNCSLIGDKTLISTNSVTGGSGGFGGSGGNGAYNDGTDKSSQQSQGGASAGPDVYP